MPTTLEQRRMLAGYAAIPQNATSAWRDAWKTTVMPFGANVQRDGLLQALAFLTRSAGADTLTQARSALLGAVRGHLFEQGFLSERPPAITRQTDLIRIVAQLDATEYMLVTREVLALSIWLKRATQALCGEGDAPATAR